MLLLTPDAVGPGAYRRLVRQRIVHPLAPGVARPADVPDCAGLRAIVAAAVVPRHTVLSGRGALWVHGWSAAPPERWTVVGARGLYRSWDPRLDFHAGVTAALGEPLGPLRVAQPARACLDALRWEPPAAALEAVVRGLSEGRVSAAELRAALAVEPSQALGFTRLVSLVGAVCAAASPAASPR